MTHVPITTPPADACVAPGFSDTGLGGGDVDPAEAATRSARSTVGGPSPLDAVEGAFTALTTGPAPLSVDAALFGAESPTRMIPLGEVRSLLLQGSTGYEVRDAVWTFVLDEARTGRPQWVIAAVGLGLPGLRRVAGRLGAGMARHQIPDLESEMLTGYLAVVKSLDTASGRIASRLCWAAYRAGDRYRRSERTRVGVAAPVAESMAPQRPWGHPDFVLARAVGEGILSDYEAELIARTRLEGVSLQDLTREWALAHSTLSDDRARAETRLAQVLDPTRLPPVKVTDRSQSASGPDNAGPNPGSKG